MSEKVYVRDRSPFWWGWFTNLDGEQECFSTEIRHRVNGKKRRNKTAAEAAVLAKEKEVDTQRRLLGRAAGDGRHRDFTISGFPALVEAHYQAEGKNSFEAVRVCYEGRRIPDEEGEWKLEGNRLLESFGKLKPHELTTADLAAYRIARTKAGVAKSTVYKELNALKAGFREYVAQVNPGFQPPKFPPMPKLANEQMGMFERWEFDLLITYFSEEFQDFLGFMYFTGWRIGEVVALRRRNVDWRNGNVWISERTKGNEPPHSRTIPFAYIPELEALLKRREERITVLEREKGIVIQHLFTNALGAPLRHNPKGPFWQTWNRARGTIDRARFKATGEVVWLVPPELPQIAWHPKGKWRPHDFRASAYSCLRRSGVETLDAMALVGHKSLETAKRYNKILPADWIESAKKLAAWHANAREEKPPVVALRKDGRQG